MENYQFEEVEKRIIECLYYYENHNINPTLEILLVDLDYIPKEWVKEVLQYLLDINEVLVVRNSIVDPTYLYLQTKEL